jgi:hypothetical protein
MKAERYSEEDKVGFIAIKHLLMRVYGIVTV